MVGFRSVADGENGTVPHSHSRAVSSAERGGGRKNTLGLARGVQEGGRFREQCVSRALLVPHLWAICEGRIWGAKNIHPVPKTLEMRTRTRIPDVCMI